MRNICSFITVGAAGISNSMQFVSNKNVKIHAVKYSVWKNRRHVTKTRGPIDYHASCEIFLYKNFYGLV